MAQFPGTALTRELLEEVKVTYVAEFLHGKWKRYAQTIARRASMMQNFSLFIEMICETNQ